MRKPAVLFDLGNTLAAYYRAEQFSPILEQSIVRVFDVLNSEHRSSVSLDEAQASAIGENREAPDFRFTPMSARLERIFDVSLADDPTYALMLCRVFLGPIFAVGQVYRDVEPMLSQLRTSGYPTAIVSNAPWGSPPDLWRGELARLGLAALVDSIVFCGDVGWRKPAIQIFEYAADSVDRRPSECLFVGDDLRWDIEGGESAGMRAILIDRDNRQIDYAGNRAENLSGIPTVLEDWI